jgi:hypothetical protein
MEEMRKITEVLRHFIRPMSRDLNVGPPESGADHFTAMFGDLEDEWGGGLRRYASPKLVEMGPTVGLGDLRAPEQRNSLNGRLNR